MKRFIQSLIAFAAIALFAVPALASAQTLGATVGVSASTSVTVRTGAVAKMRADTEITRRVAILNAVSARISQMVHVSASDKASLAAGISAQITALQSLQATIDAETDLTNLKTEVQSITKGYRIFMLVVPQARITAAGDRALGIISDLQTLSTKLEARITADASASASLQASYTDMQAKIADANIQASAAISEVAPLTPDNGVASVQASNQATLKDARAKMLAAAADLKAAYADAQAIIKGVRGTGSASATTSATVE